MTTAPYAKLRANIAGAGNLTGALVGAAGATCQLSQDPAGAGSSFLYQITDYPEGFPQPSGWSVDAFGVYFFQGLTPPSFTLPALPLWGKMLFRLTVNNGDPGTSGLDATQFIDSSTVVSTVDPSGNGFEDIAYGEYNQWDQQRKWAGAMKRNIRRMAALSVPAFTGNFGALFNGYSGLTVRAYFRGDLGVTGTTGTGKSAWSNQLGDGSAMAPGASNASNGIGSLGTLNGKAVIVTDGSTQCGQHTFPTGATAPATLNRHTYRVQALTASPTGYVIAAVNGISVFKTGATADQRIGNGTAGATSSGEALNQWHRLRCSWIGGLDVIRVGSHEPTPVSVANTAPGTSWGFAANTAGASGVALTCALIIDVEGPLATFLTAAADADAKLATFWAGATAIEI